MAGREVAEDRLNIKDIDKGYAGAVKLHRFTKFFPAPENAGHYILKEMRKWTQAVMAAEVRAEVVRKAQGHAIRMRALFDLIFWPSLARQRA